jgi:purine-binding chemotaxis protein CheW
MKNMDSYEKILDPPNESRTDAVGLLLDELIGEIDGKFEEIIEPGVSDDEESKAWEKISAHRKNQFIRFTLENNIFALPLSNASEIGQRPNITPLPNLPGWIPGISNVRGEIVSFINLKAFLGIPPSGKHADERFVIIHNHEMKVGLIVDQIKGIVSLERIDTDIQSSPYREGKIADYISGVAFSKDQLLNIIAIDKLLSSPRLNDFQDR